MTTLPPPSVSAAGSRPQKTTGGKALAEKPRGRATVKKSGKARSDKVVERTTAFAPSRPKVGPSSAAAPRDPYADLPFGEQVRADVALQYGDAERKLRDAIGQGTAHESTIDRVFQAYKGEHQANADAVAAASKAASDAVAASQAQSAAAMATMPASQNPDAQAMIAGAGAGAGQQGGFLASEAALQGSADQNAMSRLASIGEGQRVELQGARQAYVNQLGRDSIDLEKEKGAFAVKDSAEKVSGAQEQALAEEALVSKDAESQRQYKLALKRLGLDEKTLTINDQNADADRTSQDKRTQAQIDAEDKRQAAQIASQEKIAGINRRTQLDVAKIQSRGKGSKGGGVYRNYDGAAVELTDAEAKKWRQQKTLYSGVLADAGDALGADAQASAKGGKTPEEKAMYHLKRSYSGVPTEVLRAAIYAAKHGKVDGRYARILASWFPAGLVPSGFVKTG